jgi:hypothetical protein
MILEPAKSNVINMNGMPITPGLITFAWGFGHAIGQKVKLVNIGTAFRTPEQQRHRENLFDWFGI